MGLAMCMVIMGELSRDTWPGVVIMGFALDGTVSGYISIRTFNLSIVLGSILNLVLKVTHTPVCEQTPDL
jgi:hypothetical protein